jgi:PAS domain S-box-containing protein
VTTPLRVLLVEDSPDDAALIGRMLERAGFPPTVERVEDQETMRAALTRGPWDLVIADHSLPRFDSTQALQTLREVDGEVGCIIVSGSIGEEAAVAAMRAGADDYVLKDRLTQLPMAVERTLRTGRARRERHKAEGRYRGLVEHAPDGIVTVDTAGIVTSLNPAFERISGFRVVDCLGRHFQEFVHPQDAELMTGRFAATLRGAGSIMAQVRLIHRSGLYVSTEMTIAHLLDGGARVGLLAIFRDITERRSMERELRRSEAHLRTLVEHAPDGIYTLAPSGDVLSVNPALSTMLDLDFTLVGRRFREVVYPDDLAKAIDSFSRRLQGEIIPPFEIRLMKRDGSPLDVEITSSLMREGGVVTGTLGIVRDITRRKAYARELSIREERFRLVTMATQDAVYDWDLVGGTIWWSDGATRIFGERPEESDGLAWWTAQLHPDDRERVVAGLDAAAAEGRALWTDEYRLRHIDGSYRTLTDRGLYLYDDKGIAVRMIGAMTDVTARRAAETEQRRLQLVVQAAATDWTATFDEVPLLMILLDEDGRIRRLNRATRDALGLPYEALIHRGITELMGEPWRAAAELYTRAVAGGEMLMEQFEESPGGRTWNILAAPVATSEGTRAILTLRDTTDLMDLQRTLNRERTMAALGGLVAGVAHEVRNPLFAISATLDAFEARFGNEPDFSKYVGRLRPEVQRLSALMRDLLEYGRPAELQPVTGDLVPVVREAASRNEAGTAARGIHVEVRAPETPVPVRHDPARMLQVVQNLLDNALVHAPAGSTITVTVDRFADGAARWLRMMVEDAGPGFAADVISHVFEPFYSRRRGGTGLGLSIVERLVEQHGGKVTAGNRPEGGARVTVLLPLS